MRPMDKKMVRKHARQKKRWKKRGNRRTSVSAFVGVGVLFVLCCLFLQNAAFAGEGKEAKIVLKMDDVSIIQGEAVPAFTAKAVCTNEKEQDVLDEKGDYTVQDLLDELNAGTGFSISCTGDGTKEGSFPIKAELTSEITTPLYADWFEKVSIQVEEGTFTVKNAYGEWDGNKFKKWDGTYAKNEFITSKEKTYYIGDNEKKVDGWQEIAGGKYFFSPKGVMQTGWMETDKGTYYFGEQGIMQTGWLKLDDDKYYFDEEGKMLTGEQKIGARKCVFAKNGKLESQEGGVDPDLPMVALTFDDGPGPRTNELLDALEAGQAHATFFMLGQKVAQNKDVVKRMAEIGCELGNHSFDHANLAQLDAGGIQSQMEQTNQLIAEASGQRPTVGRPPYGAISADVRANFGLPVILWSVDTLDWKTRDVQSNINSVMSNLQDGQIILMHDIHTQSVDAAIQLISMIQNEGYQLVTISEMAEARGITMANGEKYAWFPKET